MITCPNCGRENADSVRLCSFCDHELRPSNAINCPNCGKLNAPENEVCPHCGTRLKESAVRPESGGLAADPWSLKGFGEQEESQPEAPPPEATLPGDRLATRRDTPSAPPEEPLGAEELPDAFTDLRLPSAPPPAAALGGSGADDLRDLFSGLTGEPAAEEVSDREQPDWFTDSLKPADEELPDEVTIPMGSAAPAEERPDWFTDSLVKEEEEDEKAVEAADDLRDWFRAQAEDEGEEESLSAGAQPRGELPDWLGPQAAQPAAPPGDLPDWLTGEPAPEREDVRGAEPEPDEEVPAWLAGEMAEEEQAEEAAPELEMERPSPVGPGLGEDLDWLAGEIIAGQEDASTGEPADEAPDWLKQAPAVPIGRAEPEKPSVVSDDWLAEALGAPPEEEAAADDWLTEALSAPPTDESAKRPAAPGAPSLDEEMPDWLRAASVKAQTGALPPLLGEEAAEEALPAAEAADWPLEGTGDEADMPEWLRAAREKAQTGTLPPLPDDEAGEETAGWLKSALGIPDESSEPREAMPLWMKAQTGGLPTTAPKSDQEPEQAGQPASDYDVFSGDLSDDMPDWLQAMQPQGLEAIEGVLPSVPAPSAEGSPFEGTLLDWLDAERPPIEETTSEAGEEGVEEGPPPEPVDLETAELPDWLRALRPEEAQAAVAQVVPAVAPMAPQAVRSRLEMLRAVHIPGVLDTDADTREESVGPLKGVVGVVAAAPVFAALQRPFVAPGGPAVEVDSVQVSLLERIFSPEAEAAPARAAAGVGRVVGRAAVTLLLLAAVVTPITGGILLFEAPQTLDVAAADAARSLGALGTAPAVLLAFEYDPSRQGELDVEAEAVVNALMDRHATLYAVSTQTSGPAIAQNLLERLAAQHGYTYGEDYLNLGYVSGEAAGVRGLVTGVTPGVVSPLAFDYQGTPTGFGSGRLTDLDLDMVVVLAGRPEAIRVWVEQAGNPSGIPMVAAVSAGAEPMVLPYYEQGRQLRGVVSGLSGATRFVLATQGPDLPPELGARWNAQVGAALVAALAILASIVAQVVRAAAARPPRETV